MSKYIDKEYNLANGPLLVVLGGYDSLEIGRLHTDTPVDAFDLAQTADAVVFQRNLFKVVGNIGYVLMVANDVLEIGRNHDVGGFKWSNMVSREHLQISCLGSSVLLSERRSANGTLVFQGDSDATQLGV